MPALPRVNCIQQAPENDGVIAVGISPTDSGPFDTNEAFLPHSRPGANRVIYLDFNGHVVNTSGNWKDGASAPPYNISGSDPDTFNTTERITSSRSGSPSRSSEQSQQGYVIFPWVASETAIRLLPVIRIRRYDENPALSPERVVFPPFCGMDVKLNPA